MPNMFSDALAAYNKPLPAAPYLPTMGMARPSTNWLGLFNNLGEPGGGNQGPAGRGPQTSAERMGGVLSEAIGRQHGFGAQMAADLAQAAANMYGGWGVMSSNPMTALGRIGGLRAASDWGWGVKGAMAYGGWAGVLDSAMRDAASYVGSTLAGFSPATLDAIDAVFGLENAMMTSMEHAMSEGYGRGGWSEAMGITGPGVPGLSGDNPGWGTADFGTTNQGGGLAGVGQAPGDTDSSRTGSGGPQI